MDISAAQMMQATLWSLVVWALAGFIILLFTHDVKYFKRFESVYGYGLLFWFVCCAIVFAILGYAKIFTT